MRTPASCRSFALSKRAPSRSKSFGRFSSGSRITGTSACRELARDDPGFGAAGDDRLHAVRLGEAHDLRGCPIARSTKNTTRPPAR